MFPGSLECEGFAPAEPILRGTSSSGPTVALTRPPRTALCGSVIPVNRLVINYKQQQINIVCLFSYLAPGRLPD